MNKIYLAGISIFLLGTITTQKIFAQINITAPSLTVSGCTFPTNYSVLGNIVLTETATNAFTPVGNGYTLILTAPTNFRFLPGTGQASFTAGAGKNVVNSISIISTTVTVTYNVNNTNSIDVLTISNLQVRGINTATTASSILRLTGAGGTGTINSDAPGAGRIHGTLTSTQLSIPAINTQPAITQTVCSGNSVSLSVASTGASSFQWYKGATLLTNGGNISGASSTTLTLNPVATGDAAANYYVVVTNSCGNITSTNSNLTVNASPTATISYAGSPYCLNAGTATVTQSGQAGGTYSSTAGLSLNSSTGAVTLGTSTAGTYTVTYSFSNGICNSSTVTSITINSPANKTISSTASSVCYNAGTNVTVAASAVGVSYQLRNNADNTAVGSPVVGTGGTINLATGNLTSTTTFNVLATTTATGCISQMVTTRTITVLPDATVSANYCLIAGYVRLTATGGSSYQWTTGETTPIIDVDIAGAYSVTVTNALGCQVTKSIVVNQELAVNGDFSAGNTGFTTQYNYAPGANALQPEGTYAINNNANYNHTFFWGTDHTSGGSGTGNFMIVNGSPASVRPIVWQQTVTVMPNTDYYFSAWALSMNNVGNDAQLRFAVDGNQVGTIDTLLPGTNGGPFNWTRFYATWNSGSATSAVISIVDLQNAASGNDFGLDNISCGTLVSPPLSVSATPTTVCDGSTLNFTSEVTGGTGPFTYLWNGPNSFSSTVQSPPSIPNASSLNNGTYDLSVTDAHGCTDSESINFTVNPLPTISIAATAASACFNTSGQTTSLTYNATTNLPTTYSITWNGTPANSFAAVTDVALPASPLSITIPPGTSVGTYTGTITVKNANNCVSTSSAFTVRVNSIPTASITGTTAVCENAGAPNITLTGANGTAPYTFTYKINGGTNQTIATTSGNFVAITAPTNSAGTFVYTLVSVQDASTPCSQAQSGSSTVTVNPLAVFTTPLTDQIYCPENNMVSFTFAGTGISGYQWQESSDGGATFTNVPAGAPYSGQSSNTLTLTGMTSIAARDAYKFKVVLSSAASCTSTSIAALSVLNIWKGITGIDWNTASNWSANLLPTLSCENVIILDVTNQPVLSSGEAFVNSLIIMPGATAKVTASTLHIAGTITNDDNSLDATGGKIDLNGDIGLNGVGLRPAQTIAGRMFATPKLTKSGRIKDLQISNRVGASVALPAVNDTLNITGHLLFGNVTGKTFTTNDNVTLVSDATGTASVDKIQVNGSGVALNYITGKLIVERYIPAHRAWRLLTIPIVNDTLSINEAWQEGVSNTNLLLANNINPYPAYGTHITGIDRTTDFVVGYDAGPQNNFSLKIHDRTRKTTALDGYQGIKHLYPGQGTNNSPTNFLQGYMLFVRGDRSVDMNQNTLAIPTPTVLRANGTLKTGTQPGVPTSDTFNVIGNPFAATLDMRKIETTGGVSEFFYLYDTRLGTIGDFQTFFWDGTGYIPLPGGGSYSAPYGSSALYNFIQSSQAFFVQSLGAGSVIIKEDAKELTTNSMIFSPVTRVQQLRANLYLVNTSSFLGSTLNQFTTGGNNSVDGKDAMKLGNIAGGTSMGIVREGKNLIIERRQLLNKFDTIFYNMTSMAMRNYRLELIAEKLDGNFVNGFVEDAYLKTSSPINLTDTTIIDFTVNSDIASTAPDRFRIVFEGRPTLITFSPVTATQQEKDVLVKWNVNNEVNIQSYYVETSINGSDFVKASTVDPRGNDFSAENYQWIDENVAPGIYYFRIMSLSITGEIQYSNVAKVIVTRGKSGIRIFPNPVIHKKIKIQFVDQPKGTFVIRLINNLGMVVLTRQMNKDDGNIVKVIHVNKNIRDGAYRLEVTKPDMSTISTNVILR